MNAARLRSLKSPPMCLAHCLPEVRDPRRRTLSCRDPEHGAFAIGESRAGRAQISFGGNRKPGSRRGPRGEFAAGTLRSRRHTPRRYDAIRRAGPCRWARRWRPGGVPPRQSGFEAEPGELSSVRRIRPSRVPAASMAKPNHEAADHRGTALIPDRSRQDIPLLLARLDGFHRRLRGGWGGGGGCSHTPRRGPIADLRRLPSRMPSSPRRFRREQPLKMAIDGQARWIRYRGRVMRCSLRI